jgi:hypothetical protein
MRHLKTFLTVIGAVTILVLAANSAVYAATGGKFILGKTNKANKVSTLKRTTSGAALNLVTKSSSNAPLSTNGKGMVANLNADKVDGLDASALRSSTLTSAVPAGVTVRGTIGQHLSSVAAGLESGFTASLPVPARVALDDAHVAVNGADEPAGACPGSATNPTAAPGYVCIYPFFTDNVLGSTGYVWGSDGAANSKFGFQVSVTANATAPTAYFANWAYTGS